MLIVFSKLVLYNSNYAKRINLVEDPFGNILSKEITINLNLKQEKRVEKFSCPFGHREIFSGRDAIYLELNSIYQFRNVTKMLIDRN